MTLSDTRILILTAPAHHPDGFAPPPATLPLRRALRSPRGC